MSTAATQDQIEKLMRDNGLNITDWDTPIAETLCIKRTEFTHEKEVRLLICDYENQCDVLNIPFAYADIFDSVVFDPRLEVGTFEDRKTELRNLGCTLSITQSDLYKMGEITIRYE